MRKIQFILSGLLAAMFFFAVHDYMLTQVDFSTDIQKEKSIVKVEHSIFHTPIILTSLDTELQIGFEESTIFPMKSFSVKHFNISLFKPPRNS